MVVGWYHSHPGFGCWLSGVDVNTQQSFEALNQRAVAVVVDPIQSVKGKVGGPFYPASSLPCLFLLKMGGACVTWSRARWGSFLLKSLSSMSFSPWKGVVLAYIRLV